MDLELVTIGTELLLGFTIDTNSAFAGRALGEIGVRIVRRTSVPDEPAAVRAAVAEALARTRLVLTTGGLGPTRDDLSKHAVAELLGLPLEFQPEIWEGLVARWARMGRKINDRNRSQAEVPRGATVLPNPRGTAPGLWIGGALGEVIMLPGVPSEMRGLLTEEVVPRLSARSGDRVVKSLMVRTTGIPESLLADRLNAIEDHLAPVTLAYLPDLEGVDLRLTIRDVPAAEADAILDVAAVQIEGTLGDHAYARGETDLAAVLLDACRQRELHLAVAESCTGGLVGTRITAIPGSSELFVGGVIAYANRVKQDFGVPARILESHGAVSEESVRAMAEAARERFGVELAGAVTGIAGPGGGSEAKPVGTVWFGFSDARGTESQKYVFPGSRHEIRTRAAQAALFGLLRRVRSAGA